MPQPITRVGYVPTPPRVSIEDITVKGETTIKFSEPVFLLDDLTKTVGGRRLAIPYLQVEVEPGENSDSTLLDMHFEASFRDNQTIVMQIYFKSAPSVSASQPEDVLKVSFWGPFFD